MDLTCQAVSDDNQTRLERESEMSNIGSWAQPGETKSGIFAFSSACSGLQPGGTILSLF